MRGLAGELALWGVALAAFLVAVGLTEPRAPRFEPGPRAPSALRVVTWNVGGAGDGGWGSSLDDASVEHVAGVLREIDPDLVFLQEVRPGMQASRLADALGEGWQREDARSTGGRKVVAFAPRGALRRVRLEGLPRGALAVELERDDLRVLAFGLHASAASSAERNDAIGAAADLLFGRGGDVLAGDLNIDLDLGKRRDLFTDDEHLDVETYNYVALRFRDAGLGAGSTAEPDRRLDYVFVDGERFDVLAAGPLKDRRGEGMDHDPVVADLRER